MNPPTNLSCSGIFWMVFIAFSLLFGAQFAKVWRVYRIFINQKICVVRYSDLQLTRVVGYLLAVDFTMLILWQVIAPVQVQPSVMSSQVSGVVIYQYQQYTCSSRNNAFLFVMLAYKGLVMIVGIMLAFETRRANMENLINDIKMVAMAVYTTALVSIVAVPVAFFIFGSPSGVEVGFILVSLAIIVLSACTLGFLFGPKLIGIYGKNVDAVRTVDEDSIQTTTITRSTDGKKIRADNNHSSRGDHSALQSKLPDEAAHAAAGVIVENNRSANDKSSAARYYAASSSPTPFSDAGAYRAQKSAPAPHSNGSGYYSPPSSGISSRQFRSSKFGPGKILPSPRANHTSFSGVSTQADVSGVGELPIEPCKSSSVAASVEKLLAAGAEARAIFRDRSTHSSSDSTSGVREDSGGNSFVRYVPPPFTPTHAAAQPATTVCVGAEIADTAASAPVTREVPPFTPTSLRGRMDAASFSCVMDLPTTTE